MQTSPASLRYPAAATLLATLLASSGALRADTLYWAVNNPAVTSWGTSANWSTTADGLGTGIAVPGVNDIINFSGANVTGNAVSLKVVEC